MFNQIFLQSLITLAHSRQCKLVYATLLWGDEVGCVFDYENEVLDKGGFGEIHRATSRCTGNSAVVKAPLQDDDKEKVRRSLRKENEEIEISMELLSKLNHTETEFFMGFLGYGTGKTRNGDVYPCIVYEAIEGGNTKSFWDKNKKKVTEEKQIKNLQIIVYRVLKALQIMHKHKWVHRDVKAANLMMRIRNEPCSTILIDYGLAKFNQRITYTGNAGTNGYKACEVQRSTRDLKTPYSTSVDQVSVGAMMLALLNVGYNPSQNPLTCKDFEILNNLNYWKDRPWWEKLFKNKRARKEIKKAKSRLGVVGYDFLLKLLKQESEEKLLQHEWLKKVPKACSAKKRRKWIL